MSLASRDNGDKDTPTSSVAHSPSITVGTDSPHITDPIIALFDNAIWRRKASDPENVLNDHGVIRNDPNSTDPRAQSKRLLTRQSLLSVLPAPELLGLVLNTTCSWWDTWRPLGPWLLDSMAGAKHSTLQEFILWAFNSDDPSVVGMAVLCVAVSIQQLDYKFHGSVISHLPRLPGELFQELFEQVDNLIVNDSDYASTREGIEVIVMSGKTLMNLGLIKKTWILNRRAISYGQLLGLHRPYRLSEAESATECHHRRQSWMSMVQGDVYLSLLLGLPYASDGRTIPAGTQGEPGTTSAFRYKLIGLSTKVIDRNQMGFSLSVPITQDIQKEVDAAVQQLDPAWWRAPAALESGTIGKEEFFERLTAQFWCAQMKVFLHMPLMIQSVEDPKLEGNRLACLEACRDLLKVHHIMRDGCSAFNMVKIVDYQAFICSTLLLLGVMGYGVTSSPDQALKSDEDRKLVNKTKELLRQASTISNNSVASQAVEGLESLTSLCRPRNCPEAGLMEASTGTCSTRIVIPYAGVVTVSPGTFYTNSRPTSPRSAPIFSLSRPCGFDSYDPSQPDAVYELSNNATLEPTQDSMAGMVQEYQSLDFDWSSIVDMNTEDDWSWLMDVNNGAAGFV